MSESQTLAAAVATVLAAVAGIITALRRSGPTTEAPVDGAREQRVLLDRIEQLTLQLDHERERADTFEHQVTELLAERDAQADRITALEGQVSMLINLLRPFAPPAPKES